MRHVWDLGFCPSYLLALARSGFSYIRIEQTCRSNMRYWCLWEPLIFKGILNCKMGLTGLSKFMEVGTSVKFRVDFKQQIASVIQSLIMMLNFQIQCFLDICWVDYHLFDLHLTWRKYNFGSNFVFIHYSF